MTLDDGAAEPLEPRKLQIMIVTERLIPEQGFDGLRLRDVAKSAKVSIGLIQHYFDTRESLILETLSHASRRRAQEWASLGAGIEEPVERTRTLLRGSIADRRRCQAWLETCSSSTRHAELLPMIARIYEGWENSLRDAVQRGIDSGDFRPVVPLEQVLGIIMTMIDGLMVAVALQVHELDTAYNARLIQGVAGRLLQHDFGPVGDEPGDLDVASARVRPKRPRGQSAPAGQV